MTVERRHSWRIEDWILRRGQIIGRLAGCDTPGSLVSSKVVEIEGKYVRTMGGSVYCLGRPDAEYLDELRHAGHEYDPEEPLAQYRRERAAGGDDGR